MEVLGNDNYLSTVIIQHGFSLSLPWAGSQHKILNLGRCIVLCWDPAQGKLRLNPTLDNYHS
jgi:hypothetical protein